MQGTAVVSKPSGGRRGVVLLIIGAVLLVIGIIALLMLQGKAVRFDKAYATHGDLSPFFFGKLEEGKSYSFIQNTWFLIVRQRLIIMLLGVALNWGIRGFWYGNAFAGLVPFCIGSVYLASGLWKKRASRRAEEK